MKRTLIPILVAACWAWTTPSIGAAQELNERVLVSEYTRSIAFFHQLVVNLEGL